MKNIKIALWSCLIGLSALWGLANTGLPESLTFIQTRNLLVQYSGVLSIALMSVAMILVTRAKWLDAWLNGLDKSYRLHKWLGIAALVYSLIHWLAACGPKWMVGLGLMTKPNRNGAHRGQQDLDALHTFFNSQRDTAEMLGEWAFYTSALLIIIALVKRIPYKRFASTHIFLAFTYLILVFHSIILMKYSTWTQPIGIVTALLMIGGLIAACLSLSKQIGKSHRISGTISSIRTFSTMNVTEIHITLNPSWEGHLGGQFAFVTFDQREGKHPFTIASAWNPETRDIMFITKGLGDYTDLLPKRINAGDNVTVEGPYGRFTFDDKKQRQIWIGSGIGITPFIARMKQLAIVPEGRTIDLIHNVKELEPAALELLKADAKGANVNLHVMVGDESGKLSGECLRNLIPEWNSASIWFCGPAQLGQNLCSDLVKNGFPSDEFHRELFNMR